MMKRYDETDDTNDLIHETCLIGQQITSLHELSSSLSSTVQTLNLHSNSISRLDGVETLHNLVHLDLSSNRLTKMAGLGTLILLRTLNLSCNGISEIQGLHGLRNLTRLNLSYNCISDLSGLMEIHGPRFKLKHLELQGNEIRTLPKLIECTIGLRSLQVLVLSHNGKDNPVCRSEHYRSLYIQSVPQVMALDGYDREGQRYCPHSSPYEIPGLDQYLEYLSGTSVDALSSSVEGNNIVTLATPRIDNALDKFKKLKVSSPSDCEDPVHDKEQGGKIEPPQSEKSEDVNSKRLELIESKLETLLSATYNPRPPITTGDAKLNVIDSESSEPEEKPVQRRKTQTRTKSNQKPTLRKPVSSREGSGVIGTTSSSSTSPHKVRVPLVTPLVERHATTNRQTDRQTAERDDNNNNAANYLQLMKDLETERDRRWKAENATRILTEQLKHLETNSTKERKFQDVAVDATQRLKQALTDSRTEKSKLENDLVSERNRNEQLTTQLLSAQGVYTSQDEALNTAKSVLAKIEQERMMDQEQLSKFRKDSHLKIQVAVRESDILKTTVRKLQERVSQLQEIIANKERDFQNKSKCLFSLHSPEFDQHIDRQMKHMNNVHEEQIKMERERYQMLADKYNELENEFRTALHIEAERFSEIKKAYENVLKMHQDSSGNVEKLTAKDKESTELIQDLTSMVKEQKGRITELTRAKNEIFDELRDRNKKLETELSEVKENLKEFENMRKDKMKLSSHVQAQDSIIQGLRKERRMWDQELAQQGSNLAQDRGRMEAKIETLHSELSTLKKLSQKETDSLKIKSKIVDDQTQSIGKLKEGLLEKDKIVRETQEKCIKIQKDLQDQITTECSQKEELQDRVDQLISRKEGLKEELADFKFEFNEISSKYTSLNKKWKDKGDVISAVETQVKQMKESWSIKEKQLIEERDQATARADGSTHKLHAIDNAFRRQLEAQQMSHDEEKQLLLAEKQLELETANEKVTEVECEMRELLEEKERNKKMMQDRMRELGGMMSGFAQGL